MAKTEAEPVQAPEAKEVTPVAPPAQPVGGSSFGGGGGTFGGFKMGSKAPPAPGGSSF